MEDVRGIWKKNQMMVLTSHFEGIPIAVVEAMMCGRPSLVTDVGGNSEWIEHGKPGFIAPGPTPALVGIALEEAWSQREEWQTIGLNANRAACDRHKRPPAERMLDLLEKTAEKG